MAGKIKRLMVIGLGALLLALGTPAFGRADVAARKNSNHDTEGAGGGLIATVAPWARVPWANGWDGDEPPLTQGRSIRGTGEFFRIR
jgi:hypothetical protein